MNAVTINLRALRRRVRCKGVAMNRTCRSTIVCVAVAMLLGTLAAQGAKSKSAAPVDRSEEESHGTSW